MKRTLIVTIATLAFALQASALDIKAITSKPTAHNPQYKDKKAWPDLVGDEYFLKQEFPKARLLIWPHAGKRFSRSNPGPDPLKPASWIDAATGQPAEAPIDMNTDLILPDARKPYKVIFKGQKNRACRHLTVGKNATFEPGGGGSLSVFGNVWIRPTGNLFVYRSVRLSGSRHTFFRRDWPEDGKLKKLHDTGAVAPFTVPQQKGNPWCWRARRADGNRGRVTYFFRHDKPGKTTEVRGFIMSSDEFRVLAGTFIVGRNSRFLCGGAATMEVNKGAAIALMDGAMAGHASNQFGSNCKLHEGGTVMGGTPDRPLRRDARYGVGYCNWMNLTFPDNAGRRVAAYGWSFSAYFSGKLIGYPAGGSDARLVIGWQRIRGGGGGRGVKATDGFNQVFAKLQPKITLWVGNDAVIENVRFEDLHRGGIVVPDAAAAAKWKNVTFGKGCLSTDAKELLREYKGKIVRGRPVDKLKPDRKEYLTP